MRKIAFVTGTRADFGKLKKLMLCLQELDQFQIHVFVTGMHLSKVHGFTFDEVVKAGLDNIYKFDNLTDNETMDQILADTIHGFSNFLRRTDFDLVFVHGDRVEAMAGALVGSLNNTLVAHIEGGELSGTIDDSLRHAISKMSHIHFVANDQARDRLMQLGEPESNVHVVGSPDVDVMLSGELPGLDDVRRRYDFDFDDFGIVIFHPVTTELCDLKQHVENLVDAMCLVHSENLIVIYPNNDEGCEVILEEYRRLSCLSNVKLLPSMRFEFFLRALQSAKFIMGNSSAGIREAPYYGVPTINIGTRQHGRSLSESIIQCNPDYRQILETIERVKLGNFDRHMPFGDGKSVSRIRDILLNEDFWELNIQKQFRDRSVVSCQ